MQATFGEDPIVDETRVGDRTVDLTHLDTGAMVDVDMVLYEGPVFDAMDRLAIDLNLVEVDRYAHAGLNEDLFNVDDPFFTGSLDVALIDGTTLPISSPSLEGTISVQVDWLY
jgi:hypothetical protein